MAGIVIQPYESQAGIRTASGGSGGQYRSARDFMTPGQENLGRGMQQLAAGMEKLGGTLFDAEIQKRQEQQELTLLEDMQGFQSESQAWADNYQQRNQGKNAVNAEVEANAFYKEKINALRQRWAGNERAQLHIQRTAGNMAISGVNAMRDYGNRQQEAWKDSVFAGKKVTFDDVASDWRSTPEEIQSAYASFAPANNAYLTSKGMDQTSAQVATDRAYRDAMSARRESGYVDKLNNGNLVGAAADLKAMEGGDAANFSAQYESGTAGSFAIGYDKNGGTSYGKFQISSKAGTFDAWLQWLDKNGYQGAAEELRSAGDADTGSRNGKVPDVWRALVQAGEITEDMQARFVNETIVGPALNNLPESMRESVQSDPALMRAFFSTAVQHGSSGAAKLFTRNWGKGEDTEAFLDSLTADRETQFASSDPEVRAGVKARLARERAAYGSGLVKPEKIRAMQNMLQTAIREQQKQATEATTLGLYASLRQEIKDLAPEEQDAVFYSGISNVGDLETRNKLISMHEKDRTIDDARQKSVDASLSARFEQMAEQQNLNYSQMLALLPQMRAEGMSEASVEKQRKRFETGRDTETKENIAATDKARRLIDEGRITTSAQIDEAAFFGGMTKTQKEEAKKYLEEGGNQGQLWQLRDKVDKALQTLREDKGKSKGLDRTPEFYKEFEKSLDPGDKLTPEFIRKRTAALLVEGERKSSSYFYRGYGENMTYGAAAAKGKGDEWLPDMTNDELAKMRSRFRAAGITDLKDEELRWVKRKELGLSVPADKLRRGLPDVSK